MDNSLGIYQYNNLPGYHTMRQSIHEITIIVSYTNNIICAKKYITTQNQKIINY